MIEETVAAVEAGDLERAVALAEAAIAEGAQHPLLFNLKAYRLERDDRLDEALDMLLRARALAPRDPAILNALGLCLGRLDRLPEALEAFGAALAAKPDFAQAHANMGRVYDGLGRLDEAKASFSRAAELDPRAAADPLANLAMLAGRQGDAAEGRRLAEQALALQPSWPMAVQALAQAEMLERRFVEAADRLSKLWSNARLAVPDRAMTLSLLGDALDGAGVPDRAFAAYQAGNAEFRKLYAPRFSGWSRQSAREMVDWLAAYFEAADPAPWRTVPPAAPTQRPRLAFLVGFPRSGTTLLEQVLASHPDVTAMEELELFGDAVRGYMRDTAALDRLAALDEAEAERLRAAYWHGVEAAGVALDRPVLIDKLPLNTIKLPLIAKLFPGAPILFAERDPRDVVLSCFRRRFRMNASMYEFLSLEGAAAFYDGVMRLFMAYEAKLPLELHRVRYERVVADFDAEIAAALAALGLDWSEQVVRFAERNRPRAVATPSAPQVARGLYGEGVGQWRRFAAQLAPVMPTLGPWARRLEYPDA